MKEGIRNSIAKYREEYAAYYHSFAQPDSPALRGSNPSVAVIPGVGIFGFAKDKREARITTEFFMNAIHVMDGANALDDSQGTSGTFPQARDTEQSKQFSSFHNYVALPHWRLFGSSIGGARGSELRRMPSPREFSGKIAAWWWAEEAASGLDIALQLAKNGAHVAVAGSELRQRKRWPRKPRRCCIRKRSRRAGLD